MRDPHVSVSILAACLWAAVAAAPALAVPPGTDPSRIDRAGSADPETIVGFPDDTGHPAGLSSLNVDLLAHLPLSSFAFNPENGNDCWGYVSPSGREYALLGLSNSLAVVEITDPANPVIVGQIQHTNSLWADVKVYRDHCYVTNESGGGFDVIDLSDVDQGVVTLVRRVTTNNVRTSHNVAINEDSGYLYLAGANINRGALVAFDLSDPSNPVYAGAWNGVYVHDVQIVTLPDNREIAYCANGGDGLWIVDVTDKSNMTTLASRTYPGLQYCHQCWTEDNQYLFVNDELDELNGTTNTTRTLVFDVSDLTNPTLVDTFTSGLPATDHNLYVRDGFVYEANYTSGLRIFDVSDPFKAVEVGWIDTYPSSNGPGFNGAWSVYPYFPSGTVIISDIQGGLFIVDPSDALSGLSISYPDGRPELVDPAGGTPLRVSIRERNATLDPGAVDLFVDAGAGFVEVPMSGLGGNVFEAAFPPSDCGEPVSYYVRAMTVDGREFLDPPGAPDTAYEALSAAGFVEVLVDDFEADLGWRVENSNVTDGAWQRGVPAGDGSRGDPTDDFDGSGRCYLTGNRSGNSDLDGGPTILISPTVDLSGTTAPLLRYARWMHNDDGDDFLITQLSDDGGSTWVEVGRVINTGGWQRHEVRIADHIDLTDQVVARFIVSDNPNDSVTEAAIDAVAFVEPECEPAMELSVDPLFAGQDADLTVINATPGGNVYFVYSLRGEGSTNVPPLNVTLDLDRPALIGAARANASGTAVLTRRVPAIGRNRVVWFQAAEFNRTSQVVLTQIN